MAEARTSVTVSGGPAEELIAAVGFDPSKRGSPTQELFGQAFDAIKKDREQKRLDEAKTVAGEAVNLLEQRDKLVKDFQNAMQKLDKSIGKMVKRLRGGAQPGDSEGSDTEPTADAGN